MTAEVDSVKTEIAFAGTAPRTWLWRDVALDLAARATVAAIFIIYGLPDFLKAVQLLGSIVAGDFSLYIVVEALALLSAWLFMLLIAYLAIRRLRPTAKSSGLAPRIAALLGAAIPMTMGLLPLNPHIGIAGKLASVMLVLCGSALSFYVLRQLGRSFSIMPEARQLVTTGPYAIVRHPLYWAEFICCLGVLIQFWSLTAAVILAIQVSFQLTRMGYEERILQQTFPEYVDYSRRTARLIPGLY